MSSARFIARWWMVEAPSSAHCSRGLRSATAGMNIASLIRARVCGLAANIPAGPVALISASETDSSENPKPWRTRLIIKAISLSMTA